jgi:furin
MNVQEAWAEGITGKGSVVTILDDGLEKDHPDIIRNYVHLFVLLPST